MSQYPAQPYGVQVQHVPQYGYAQPGYGQPPGYEHGQAPSPQQMVYVNGVPGHYEEVVYPGPITCLSCAALFLLFPPLSCFVFCCPCDKKTEFHPTPGAVVAPPGATVTYFQQPQPAVQYQQPEQNPGYYPKT